MSDNIFYYSMFQWTTWKSVCLFHFGFVSLFCLFPANAGFSTCEVMPLLVFIPILSTLFMFSGHYDVRFTISMEIWEDYLTGYWLCYCMPWFNYGGIARRQCNQALLVDAISAVICLIISSITTCFKGQLGNLFVCFILVLFLCFFCLYSICFFLKGVVTNVFPR